MKSGATAGTTGWKRRFLGKWRIVHMDDFTNNDIDIEVPAHITLEKGAHGSIHFILVSGEIDGKYVASPGTGLCTFDFTWAGNDECDEASGDGWMAFLSDTRAEGEIRFHCGDTHTFRAERKCMKSKNILKCSISFPKFREVLNYVKQPRAEETG